MFLSVKGRAFKLLLNLLNCSTDVKREKKRTIEPKCICLKCTKCGLSLSQIFEILFIDWYVLSNNDVVQLCASFFIDIVMVPVWQRKNVGYNDWYYSIVIDRFHQKRAMHLYLKTIYFQCFFAILPQRSNCSGISISNTRFSIVVILKSKNVIYFEKFQPVITNRHFEKCVQCTIPW